MSSFTKRLILHVIIFFPVVIFAQLPSLDWARCYGGTMGDNCFAMCEAFDGSLIVAGTTSSSDGDLDTNLGGADVWLMKIDTTNGNIIWQHNLGGSGYDNAYSIIRTSDGGYIFTGDTKSPFIPGKHNGANNYDMYVCKTDSSGNLIWHYCYGGSDDDGGYSIKQRFNGNYIIAGYAGSNDGDVTMQYGIQDYWIIEIDTIGNLLWQKSFGSSTYDYATGIHEINSSHFIVTGHASSNDSLVTGNHGGNDYWIIKIDTAGNIIWQKSYGGSHDDYTYSSLFVNNKIIVNGWSYSDDGDVVGMHWPAPDGDIWTLILDSVGNILANRCFGGSSQDISSNIMYDSSKNIFVIAGTSRSIDGDAIATHGSSDYWAVGTDWSLYPLWQKSYGGSDMEFQGAGCVTSNSAIYIAGTTAIGSNNTGDVTGYHGGRSDLWVIKLTSPLINDIAENNHSPFKIFPNPFSHSIRISSDESDIIDYSIYDLHGKGIKEVKALHGQSMSLDLSFLNAGIYFIKIKTITQNFTFKLIKS